MWAILSNSFALFKFFKILMLLFVIDREECCRIIEYLKEASYNVVSVQASQYYCFGTHNIINPRCRTGVHNCRPSHSERQSHCWLRVDNSKVVERRRCGISLVQIMYIRIGFYLKWEFWRVDSQHVSIPFSACIYCLESRFCWKKSISFQTSSLKKPIRPRELRCMYRWPAAFWKPNGPELLAF